MPRPIAFIILLVKKSLEEDIFERANGLTYRILLAFFPFLIFLLSLMGFMNLDESTAIVQMVAWMPVSTADMILRFVAETAFMRSAGLLSAGLFFAVYNTTNGFRAVIRCANHSIGIADDRGMVKRVAVSLVLMLLFTGAIVMMLILLVFGRALWEVLVPGIRYHAIFTALASFFLLVITTTLIFRLALAKKMRLRQLVPGALITVVLWMSASAVFGFAVMNFTQYSVIYGSIAGIFILVLWLNMVSLILLVGLEFNAVYLLSQNEVEGVNLPKHRIQ